MDTVNPETGEVTPGGVIARKNVHEVAKRLCRVMDGIEKLPKTGWNDYHNYAYPTESDVMETVRPICAEHGLAVVPSVVSEQVQEIETSSGTSKHIHLTLDVWLIADSDEEAFIASRWHCEGIDNQDKGINKCYSAGLKYWALKTFLMSSEDDVEREDHEVEGRSPKKQRGQSSGGGYDPLGLDDEMPFGKHKGKTIEWLCENQRGYLRWLLYESDMDFEVEDEVVDYAKEQKEKENQPAAPGENEPAIPASGNPESPDAEGDMSGPWDDEEELPY